MRKGLQLSVLLLFVSFQIDNKLIDFIPILVASVVAQPWLPTRPGIHPILTDKHNLVLSGRPLKFDSMHSLQFLLDIPDTVYILGIVTRLIEVTQSEVVQSPELDVLGAGDGAVHLRWRWEIIIGGWCG